MRLTALIAGLLVSLVVLAAPEAVAEGIDYTDQGVNFKLVADDQGDTVEVRLTVDTDSTGDFLTYVGFKIWADDPPAGDGVLESSPDTGYSFLNGYRSGGNGSTSKNGTGWAGADFGLGGSDYGVELDGSTYTFEFSFDTTKDWLDKWSIKAWTADDDGSKSRQWSSGEMTPVPEPGTLMLLGLGIAGVVAARRRRLLGAA